MRLKTYIKLSLIFLPILSACTKSESHRLIPYVECTERLGYIPSQFDDNLWTKEKIEKFLLGRWSWRIYGYHSGISRPHVEREIIFREGGRMEIYQPKNVLQITSNFQINEEEGFNERQYRLIQTSSKPEVFIGNSLIYPCGTELVLYKSNRDLADEYYIKINDL